MKFVKFNAYFKPKPNRINTSLMMNFLKNLSQKQKLWGGISVAAIATVGTLYFTGFFRKSESITIIPNDAFFVGVMNLSDLNDKADLEDFKDSDFYEVVEEMGYFGELVEDPSKIGLDLSSDIFVFGIQRDAIFVAMTMDMDDEDDFETFLEELNDETRFAADFEMNEGEGYSYILLNEGGSYESDIYYDRSRRNQDLYYGGIIAWDDDKVLILANSDGRSDESDLEDIVEELWNLESGDRISSSDNFMTFYEEKKDVSLWMNLQEVAEMSGERDLKQASDIVGEMSTSMHLNFEEEGIRLEMSLTMDPEEMEDYDNSLSYLLHMIEKASKKLF